MPRRLGVSQPHATKPIGGLTPCSLHVLVRLRTLVVLAADLASVTLVTTAQARGVSPKPTVVLVHGAFADSSGWGVIDRLRHDGYPVRAAPDPLLGLRFDADTVRAFIDSIPGPEIPVGHSYGGAVITQAASGDPQVKALVDVAAFAPTRGERLNQLLMRRVAHPIAPLPLVSIKVKQPNGTTRTDIYLKPSKFRARFAADLPPRVAADLAATQPPTSAAAFTAKLTVTPTWKTIPSWYLVAKQDRRSRPTWSGSWPAASTRTPTRSTARTPSTSAIPRQSPASPSKRPATR